MANKKPKGIPIFWNSDEELQTHYINQMFISHSGGDFYIEFGEMTPPVRNENMPYPEKIFVKPIFRIAITSEKMKEFLDIFTSNYKLFEESKKKQGKQ